MNILENLSPKNLRLNQRIAIGGGVLVGLLFLGIAAFEADQNRRFEDHVQRVMGKVERLYIQPGSGKRSESWMVDYSYNTSAAIYHQEHGIDSNDWRALRVGRAIPIKYLGDLPGDSRVDFPTEDKAHRDTPKIMGGIGLGMWVITGFLFRKYRRESCV